MSQVYLIKPLEKKSIVYHVEMYRKNSDDSISWFNLDETYRWGQGFVEGDLDCNLPWEGDPVAYARTDCGWGCVGVAWLASVSWLRVSRSSCRVDGGRLAELRRCGAEWPVAAAALVFAGVLLVVVAVAVSAMAR